MKNKNLTIILTLKGRDEFTKRILDFYSATCFPYKIIIGDGIPHSSIKKLLKDEKYSNLDYEYYEFDDKTPHDYYKKMLNLLQKVSTPYVMLTDNDDYLIEQYVARCTKFLDENSEYVSCGGAILGFDLLKRKKTHKSIILNEKLAYPPLFIEQRTPLERVTYYCENYTAPCWYNIFRTDAQLKSWSILVKEEITDFLIMESFISLSTTILGKHKTDYTFSHYIRQTNSSQCNSNIKSFMQRIVHSNLGEDIKKMLSALTNQLSTATGEIEKRIIKEKISDSYAYYLEKSNQHPPQNLFSTLKDMIKKYIYTFRYIFRSINKIFREYDLHSIKKKFLKQGASREDAEKLIESYRHLQEDVCNKSSGKK